MRQPSVEIGSDALSGNIPRTFDLVTLTRPIPLRVSRTVPAVQSAAFKRIDIAECAGVGKVELDDIVTAVEWCAREWPPRRTLTGGRERTGRRRGTDARSGRGGTGRGGGWRYDWSGLGRSWHSKRDGRSRSWQNGRHGEMRWQGRRREASTFSDDANLRSGGRAVTSSSSCILARFPSGCGRSSIAATLHITLAPPLR